MKREMVTMSTKEQRRMQVLNGVEAGRLTALGAAELLGLSTRQTKRLLVAYRQEGLRLRARIGVVAGGGHVIRRRLRGRCSRQQNRAAQRQD